jgi:hypothetical protein
MILRTTIGLCVALSMVACSDSNASGTDSGPDSSTASGDAAPDSTSGTRGDADADALPDATPDNGPDGNMGEAARPCQGGFPPRDGDRVCAGAWFGCQETYAANDCQGKVCCVLPPDGGPPYLGDGGSCPGPCAMPDDIGCPMWYRSNVCVLGSLCCPNRPLDGGTD